MITIDLSKQHELDANRKAIQQISFSGNLNRNRNTTMFFIIEETKKSILDFSQGTDKVLWMLSSNLANTCSTNYFALIWYHYKMTQYNLLNVKLSDSQLDKLKSGIKNDTEATLKLSLNVASDSNDENNT